jgi:CRP/FNR family transcriptional regulator
MVNKLAVALSETKAAFRKNWADRIKTEGYSFEVEELTGGVRQRHKLLWEHLLKAFETEVYDEYLCFLEQEGRYQARANTRIESLINQLTALFNVLWDTLVASPTIEEDPQLLFVITKRLNRLRVLTEKAILTGYQAELPVIQEQQAAESAEERRLRLERTSLAELVKSIPAFRINHYKENHTIFQPGEKRSVLYFVMTGRVKIYELLPDGRAITLSILNDNDVFAQFNNNQNYFRDVYAEVMQDGIIASLQEASLEALMEQSPLLALRIINSFSQQLSQSQLLIQGLLGRDVAVRLVNLMLKLANEFGTKTLSGGVSIELTLTHQEIADMIGSNRVTVTRKLLELQKKNLINIQNRTIHITDRRKLEQMVA